MSSFAVAAFHDAALPAGAASVEAVLWIRAAGIAARPHPVFLRLWTPRGAAITQLREISPGTGDLLAEAVRLDERTIRCACGEWTDGVYEYALAIALPVRGAGDQMLAARVGVVAGEALAGTALICVTWTDAPDSERAGAIADVPTAAPARRGAAAPARRALDRPCPDCGAQGEDGDRFCEACGRPLC